MASAQSLEKYEHYYNKWLPLYNAYIFQTGCTAHMNKLLHFSTLEELDMLMSLSVF